MIKQLFLLSGLAILGVICNHATGWGFIAMFWWTDRYQSVSTPCFDQVGTLPYYALLAIQQLVVFSVPAFLFVSGFFVAYTARGSQSKLSWGLVRTRIRSLLIPYIIWSTVIFVGDAFQGIIYAPSEYLRKLVSGQAIEAYFYVPLLCQFYLISPLVTPLAKTKPKLVLSIAALLQLGTLSLRYLVAYGVETPTLVLLIRLTPVWLFPIWAFFFPFGIVFGFHVSQFKQWLPRLRWGLLVTAGMLGLLAILEPQAPLNSTGIDWGRGLHSISSNLYAIVFILSFLAFDQIAIPGSKTLNLLGRNSYGIYLLHSPVLEFSARVIRQILPLILAYQVIFQSLLVVLGVGVPLFFMAVVSKSRIRKSYSYLFG